MSDQRYQSGVVAGIKNSIPLGNWPDELAGYGTKHGGQPYTRCERCPREKRMDAFSFVRYGKTTLCKSCALHLARAEAAAESY